MASAIKKVNMISRIVRLKHIVQRWKNKSFTRHRSALKFFESDEPESGSNRRCTPRGSVAVTVGPGRHRFIIPTRFLNLPVFVDLLHQSGEEFGYENTGPIFLPCDPGLFKEMLMFLEEDEERFRGLGLEEFSGFVEMGGVDQSTCKGSRKCHGFTPLLPKARV